MAFTEEERLSAANLARTIFEITRDHNYDCTCALCRAWMYLYSIGANKGFNVPKLDSPVRTRELIATATVDNPEGRWNKRG